MNPLQIEIAGLKLRNPLMLASGILGDTGGSLRRIADAGAGALVTKSIGMVPRKGHPNPTLVEVDGGYLNSMGLPNPGIEAFQEEINQILDCGIPIIGSIFATDPREFANLASRMEAYGASAVELNLSCPHASGFGMELGVDPDVVREIVAVVKSALSIPVFVKITPNTHRILEVGGAVQDAGGDGVVAINTLRAMAISIDLARPRLANRIGGLSGPAVKPIGLRCVYELYESLNIPVIGVGGIVSWRDAIEYLMAGASGFQVGSAIGAEGIQVIGRILDGVRRYMSENGYDSIDQMVGVAHV